MEKLIDKRKVNFLLNTYLVQIPVTQHDVAKSTTNVAAVDEKEV